MPVIHAEDATVHEMHGTTFTSYASPSRGSEQLCAWRVEIPAGSAGVAHTVTHEEVLCLTSGAVRVTLDGESRDAVAGDVILVPAGASFRVDNPAGVAASAWVTTSVGLSAQLADGSRITPPWTL